MTPFTADQRAAITEVLNRTQPSARSNGGGGAAAYADHCGRKSQHEALTAALGKLMTPALQYDEFGPCAPGDDAIDTSDIPEAGKEFFEHATLRARERLSDQIIDAINSLVTAQIRGRVGTNMTTRMSAMREQEQAETRLRILLREVIRAR